MEKKLIFVIGSPRSGSTLLQRMLGAHSAIYTCPEPHIITPLAHLGYYHSVDKAPYDHLRGVDAIRDFVDNLPGKEADYLDACRAYTDVLYSRRLDRSGKKLFLDKTPAYALVLDFLSKLYPGASYVVLTRHPAAIFTSYASSFFNGDYKAAHDFNPILERYVPAIARFLQTPPVSLVHVRYENLVSAPQREMEKILAYLTLPFEQSVIEYGKHRRTEKGLGDPVSVNRQTGPVTDSVHKWARELLADDEKAEFIHKMTGMLDPEDLNTWGYPGPELFAPLDSLRAEGVKQKKPPLDGFQIQRKILLLLRRNIHHNMLGRIIRKIRFFCDVLLR